jgi:hypothetical protein
MKISKKERKEEMQYKGCKVGRGRGGGDQDARRLVRKKEKIEKSKNRKKNAQRGGNKPEKQSQKQTPKKAETPRSKCLYPYTTDFHVPCPKYA